MPTPEDEPFGDVEFLRISGRDRPRVPRIPPLRDDELDEVAAEMLDRAGLGRPTMFMTFIRDQRLFRRWNAFGGTVLRGRLPARTRELLILRATWLCGCDYLWESHVRAGLKVGLTLEEAERVAAGPSAVEWSELDAALLWSVDELHSDGCISDRTWGVLANCFDDLKLMEIPMLVGCYVMNSYAVNSFGVPQDEIVTGHPPERRTVPSDPHL